MWSGLTTQMPKGPLWEQVSDSGLIFVRTRNAGPAALGGCHSAQLTLAVQKPWPMETSSGLSLDHRPPG